jgi:hypothetical protein
MESLICFLCITQTWRYSIFIARYAIPGMVAGNGHVYAARAKSRR